MDNIGYLLYCIRVVDAKLQLRPDTETPEVKNNEGPNIVEHSGDHVGIDPPEVADSTALGVEGEGPLFLRGWDVRHDFTSVVLRFSVEIRSAAYMRAWPEVRQLRSTMM
jgi:hypothetical protein